MVYIFLPPSRRSGASFKCKNMLSMFMLSPPSKVQGREEVWLSVVLQSVLLWLYFMYSLALGFFLTAAPV